MRQPRVGLLRLESQPHTPGDSGRLRLQRVERVAAIQRWQVGLPRPEVEELAERAVEQQRSGVGISHQRLRGGDEVGDDARPLSLRRALVARLGVSYATRDNARRVAQAVTRMLARAGWMRHGVIRLS